MIIYCNSFFADAGTRNYNFQLDINDVDLEKIIRDLSDGDREDVLRMYSSANIVNTIDNEELLEEIGFDSVRRYFSDEINELVRDKVQEMVGILTIK